MYENPLAFKHFIASSANKNIKTSCLKLNFKWFQIVLWSIIEIPRFMIFKEIHMDSIITWNVNGIRAIKKKGFFQWLEQENPDLLCIQETKAQVEQLEKEILSPKSYKSYWMSAEKKGYSGVATYTKKEPLKVDCLGIEKFDREGRVQILHYREFTIINAYFPNSQEKGKRLDYKIEFCNAILQLCNHLHEKKQKIILCGDYNIAHKPIDLKNPDANENNPGYLPQEREWMDQLIKAGYIDTFRMFNKEGENYTWWSYRTRARERNAGWRIDYHCINPLIKPMIKNCTIMKNIMGSDHCPVKLQLHNCKEKL